MADKSKEKKGKDKKKGKGDSAKPAEGSAPTGEGGPSLAEHPRAVRAVARAKSWGALAGFALGGYLSLPTHTPAQAGFRALLAGIVCYVAVWAASVFLWRRLVAAELRHHQHELLSEELARLGLHDPPSSLSRG
jgi:hypothetical protein